MRKELHPHACAELPHDADEQAMRQPITLAPLDPRDGGLRDARPSGELGLRPSAAPPQGADPEPEPDRIHDASMSAAAYLADFGTMASLDPPSSASAATCAAPHTERVRRQCTQPELVEQARRGDHDAFAVLAGAAIPRLDALARLILRDPERGQGRHPGGARARLARPAIAPRPRTIRRLVAPPPRPRLHGRGAASTVDTRSRSSSHRSTIPRSGTARSPSPSAMRSSGGSASSIPEQRALIVLHHYLDLSLPEVAETMRIPLGTAKSRLHRALSAMRACARGRRQDLRPSSRRAVSHDSARRLHPAPRHLARRRRASR